MTDAPPPALGELARCAQEYADAIAAYEEPDLSHLVVHARGNAMERAENAFQKRCTPYVILQLVALATGGAEDTARLDWLASTPRHVDQVICPPGNHGGGEGNWLLTHESQSGASAEWEGPTLRAAIDAARSLTPERPADAD